MRMVLQRLWPFDSSHLQSHLRKIAAVLLVGSLLGPVTARAGATYFTTPQLLREFFPKSERVTYQRIKLTKEQVVHLVGRLGYRPAKAEYIVFVALTGDHVDGYAVIDDEKGQHEPITFGVKLSPEGVVERQEVMVYREAYGEEIVDKRFKVQFQGKSSRDVVRAGQDIDVVAGATISSRSMAIGVRRAIALVEELVLKLAPVAEQRNKPKVSG